jgi:hypothetical protein
MVRGQLVTDVPLTRVQSTVAPGVVSPKRTVATSPLMLLLAVALLAKVVS